MNNNKVLIELHTFTKKRNKTYTYTYTYTLLSIHTHNTLLLLDQTVCRSHIVYIEQATRESLSPVLMMTSSESNFVVSMHTENVELSTMSKPIFGVADFFFALNGRASDFDGLSQRIFFN